MSMSIYRFGNMIAVNPPEGETFYLSVTEGSILWRAVKEITNEIDGGIRFTNSKVGTVSVQATGSRYDKKESRPGDIGCWFWTEGGDECLTGELVRVRNDGKAVIDKAGRIHVVPVANVMPAAVDEWREANS